ncbi:hypothetical protein SLEP1_g41992 [Rubroshorea leprosula]|uniref:DUF676 domain-containing protein n=2 Tax=Rubroshorea leprosula TaxID=152421 RepID=A0AAV5L9P0_9ROSI|nr:hypothetical protein SLEP1_g41992 [Rubroshorea leprosula]
MAARCNSFPFSCRTCRAGARSGPLSLLLSLRLIISFPLFPTGLHPDTLKLSSRRWNRVVSALVSEETAIGSRFSGTDAFKLTYLELTQGPGREFFVSSLKKSQFQKLLLPVLCFRSVWLASMEEVEGDSRTARDKDDDTQIKNVDSSKKKRRRRRKKVSRWLRFGCLKMESDEGGGVDLEVDFEGKRGDPTHLVIMINGILGSSQNWKYAAKQFLKKYPQDLIVHCSKSNCNILTLDGIDVMGERLENEVVSVIKHHPSLQKISFVGHSLGGLVARYAIARLYELDITGERFQGNGACGDDHQGDSWPEEKFKDKIAGLEPVNFITSATPHLGSLGHKQVPMLCGFHTLEKVAARTSSFLGRTGKHLFLTDRDEEKPPLLLQMVRDCEDLKFISALRSFRRCVAYSNARFDHIVGWSTSSIRHQNELPKIKHLKGADKYPHIINEEVSKISASDEEPLEAKINGCKKLSMEGLLLNLFSLN